MDVFAPESIQPLVTEALKNVFSTMMEKDIELESALFYPNDENKEPEGPTIISGKTIVTGSVGFTGKVNGIIYISMDESMAEHITGAFLGMTPEEVAEEGHEIVNDALGELTNMSVGDFKNRLCDLGFNCMLTLPSILRGNNLTIESNVDDGVKRYIHYFKSDGQSLVVDIIIKPEE